MITEALWHFPGLGPKRRERLADEGVRSWSDLTDRPESLPRGCSAAVIEESERCLTALAEDNVGYFVDRFAPQDKWRILQHYIDRVSYFDIETDGLDYDSRITMIACWHNGKLHTFLEHENLDGFLHLLDDVTLLASFNGVSFDVPRVLDAFHIPTLPCPHLDLRWTSYHQGYRGGLKDISMQCGIERPRDLWYADGELAVELWYQWRSADDEAARQKLIRYCAADVLLTLLLGEKLVERETDSPEKIWKHLPDAVIESRRSSANVSTVATNPFPAPFSKAAPSKLRARRR